MNDEATLTLDVHQAMHTDESLNDGETVYPGAADWTTEFTAGDSGLSID